MDGCDNDVYGMCPRMHGACIPLFCISAGLFLVGVWSLFFFFPDEFPCLFFHKRGYCSYNNNCKYSHAALTEETREILEKVSLLGTWFVRRMWRVLYCEYGKYLFIYSEFSKVLTFHCSILLRPQKENKQEPFSLNKNQKTSFLYKREIIHHRLVILPLSPTLGLHNILTQTNLLD